MTARDVLRWIGVLTVLEGLAFAIGGRGTARFLARVAPGWYRLWLKPLDSISPLAIRAIGAFQVALGLRILAMVPPAPTIVRLVASVALAPTNALWQAAVARPAEYVFDDLLRQFVPPGARVLDLGCGEGDNLARLLQAGLPFGSYLGLDTSPAVLARARARFTGFPKVDFVRNDLLNEPLPSGEFDLIVSTWALDRIEDPFALIVRALRQLRQGGRAILLFASPPRDGRGGFPRLVASLTGRHLYPASIYYGLPSFAVEEEFSNGLVSLVILESPTTVSAPISTAPP